MIHGADSGDPQHAGQGSLRNRLVNLEDHAGFKVTKVSAVSTHCIVVKETCLSPAVVRNAP